MATASDTDRRTGVLYRFIKELRGSLLLSTVAVGVGLIAFAALLDSPITITQNDGILAGMFGVFGISAILAGGTFYLLLKALHRD